MDAGRGPPEALTTAEREELTKLRRENERLQMEREILIAAAFLVPAMCGVLGDET